MLSTFLLILAGTLPLASAHIAFYHPSMYGFNVTDKDFDYDNRPMAPIQDMTFDQWWFHGHLGHPPNPGDFFELPAGQPATAELACSKSHTSFFASDEGRTDLRQNNSPCPGEDGSFITGAMHTNGFQDLKGCALAIAYESDVSKIQPEDFTVFSINQTCVWTQLTDFQVPERMPPCPEDGCHCAFFWIHSDDSGGEQNYMNGFKCKVTNSTSNVALAKPQVPRRCGADPDYGKPEAAPGNCTYGAKQPFYWFQKERNNMFEGQYAPPYYTDLYNFKDGAQDDIFVDSYPNGLPAPSPNSTFVPTPYLGEANGSSAGNPSSSMAYSSSYASSSVSPSPSSDTQPSSSASISSSAQTSSTFSATIASSTSASSIESVENAPPSTAVTVSTSTVVSTVVVTVTAVPSSTNAPGSATSSQVTSSSRNSPSLTDSAGANSPAETSASTPMPTSTDTNAQTSIAGSTIILGAIPTSGTVKSNYAVLSSGNASGAGKTITLSEKARDFTLGTSIKPGVLVADSSPSGKACKREYGMRKVFRRRVLAASSAVQAQQGNEDNSLLVRLGLGRHRKLQARSRLWSPY